MAVHVRVPVHVHVYVFVHARARVHVDLTSVMSSTGQVSSQEAKRSQGSDVPLASSINRTGESGMSTAHP